MCAPGKPCHTRHVTQGPVVEVAGLTHRYGEITALQSLDLSIPHGITGLVGANGAGKTTLLRLLLGLLHPADGSLRVLGNDPQSDPLAVRSRIGYMPEVDCLPKDQTAADFVAYTAQLAGIPRREAKRRASETLFLVGLEEERFRFLGDFSTGMQQRVKLAQAIVHDPDLLLLDEPAGGLDPEGRQQMLALIRRLGEFDIAVIVSSHVLTDIEDTCSWVVMLDGGRLLRSGPLGHFDELSTVRVELLEPSLDWEKALTAAGLEVATEGRTAIVGPGDHTIEQTVVAAAAQTNTGLVRMTRGSASLEDLFLENDQ